MPEPVRRCPACGYPAQTDPCGRCHGTIHDSGDGHRIVPGRGNWVTDFAHGFWTFFAAAAHLWNRREYVGRLTGPILANLVVLALAFGVMFWIPYELLQDWFGGGDGIGAWLATSAALLAAVVTFWLTAPVVVECVTAPFLDPLASATEEAFAGGPMPAVDASVWRGAMVGARSAAQLLLIQLLLLPVLVLLSATGVGAIPVFAITAWLNALVWFDIPGARRGLGLRERSRLLRRNLARTLGFGAAAQLALFIPVFNVVLLTPAAAVGATILYFHFDKPAAPRAPAAPENPPPS